MLVGKMAIQIESISSKGNPIFQSLAARIIEDNGYEVVIAKSSSQSTTIRSLDWI